LLLTIIYTINLPVVRPRSCRVIYYFDTPALGRRHQSFGRVSKDTLSMEVGDEKIEFNFHDAMKYPYSNVYSINAMIKLISVYSKFVILIVKTD